MVTPPSALTSSDLSAARKAAGTDTRPLASNRLRWLPRKCVIGPPFHSRTGLRIGYIVGYVGLSWVRLGVKGICAERHGKRIGLSPKNRQFDALCPHCDCYTKLCIVLFSFRIFGVLPSGQQPGWRCLPMVSHAGATKQPTPSHEASGQERQTVCKPGSVRTARSGPGRPFLWDAPCGAPHATNPGGGAGTPSRHMHAFVPHAAGRPYSVLLPVGFTLPAPLPERRCALTAPFHPCLRARLAPARTGGLFSVALSLGSPPPAVSRHRIPVEPGLSSPMPWRTWQRPSNRLAAGCIAPAAAARSTGSLHRPRQHTPRAARSRRPRARPRPFRPPMALKGAQQASRRPPRRIRCPAAPDSRRRRGRRASFPHQPLIPQRHGAKSGQSPTPWAGEPAPVEQLARILLAVGRDVGMGDDIARRNGMARQDAEGEITDSRHLRRREKAGSPIHGRD